jgi:hypothetical protein
MAAMVDIMAVAGAAVGTAVMVIVVAGMVATADGTAAAETYKSLQIRPGGNVRPFLLFFVCTLRLYEHLPQPEFSHLGLM